MIGLSNECVALLMTVFGGGGLEANCFNNHENVRFIVLIHGQLREINQTSIKKKKVQKLCPRAQPLSPSR